MALSKKQMILLGGVSLAGLGAYLLFRKPTKGYYDNIWCNNDECSNILEDFGGIQGYIDNKGIKDEDLKQNLGENATYDYDGEATVTLVVNKNIVRIDRARQGTSPVEGGEAILPSVWSNISPF